MHGDLTVALPAPGEYRAAVMKDDMFGHIHEYVAGLPVFSDHEHHLPDEFFAEGMTLDRLFAHSYVAWTGFVPDGSAASRQTFLDNVGFNSYFTWMARGIRQVHALEREVDLDSWDQVSEIVTAAYARDPDFHWRALADNGYQRLILDTYWDPGGDDGHPEIFTPTFRIDPFLYGHHAEAVGPNDIVPWEHYAFPGGSLDDYVERMLATVRKQHAGGRVVALKCAEAYNRTVDFLPDDREGARRCFGKHPDRIEPAERILFGNYIFNRCCELAGELALPFQVHTGLARIRTSNPMNFEPILERYPGVRFVLFHAGYPWTHEVAGLAHNDANALPSLTWTATICTSAAIRALHDFIDVACSANSITWGSDCWVAEESVGAMLAWRFVVAKVLSERLQDGRLTMGGAESLARKLMHENGRGIYGFERGPK